jgi:hypothetical protein
MDRKERNQNKTFSIHMNNEGKKNCSVHINSAVNN